MPRSILHAREAHAAYTKKVVMKRIHDRALHGRPDFLDSMLKHRGEKDGLTDAELVSNSAILVLAGSETTATWLSGVTYWLLRTPQALRKVTDEVRNAFESETEINFTNATAGCLICSHVWRRGYAYIHPYRVGWSDRPCLVRRPRFQGTK